MLGSADITSANTWTEIYAVPSGKSAVVSCRVVNRSAAPAVIRIAIGPTTSGAIGNQHHIEFDVSIPANSVLENSGLALLATQKVWVRCSLANVVNAIVYGIED